MNKPTDFQVGQRIKMHPATGFFIMGAVYGDVVKVGRKKVYVKLDKVTRILKTHPDNILDAEM